MSRELNPKQLKFVQLYLETGNATKSLIEAGYKTKNAKKVASRLLLNPKVISTVDKSRLKVEKKIEVNFEWVLSKLKQVAEAGINTNELDATTRALAEVNKMLGNYAPVKTENTNTNNNVSNDFVEMEKRAKRYRDEQQCPRH